MVLSKTYAVASTDTLNNIEEVLEHLGGFGKFQIFILVLLCFMEIPTGFLLISPVFAGATPEEWKCGNLSVFKSDPDFCNCNETLSSPDGSSFVSEWGLVCELSWVSDFITSLQMLGMVVGNILTGQCADWYGRRWTYLLTVSWLAFGTLLTGVSPNIYILALARLVCGMGFAGYTFLSVTYAMEFMTPRYRVACASCSPLGWGIMIMGIIGYYFHDSWRKLMLVSAIPYALIIVIFPLIPESPRWLMRNKRVEEAHKVFSRIAKMNTKSPVDIEVLWRLAEVDKSAGAEKVQKVTYVQFFKNKEVRFTCFCLMLIWSTWSIMYFGISFNIKNFGGNPFWNVVWVGLCDILGYPSAYLINQCLTRRRSLAFFMTGCAVFLVSLALVQLKIDVQSGSVIIIVLCLMGKYSAAGARACARTLTGESFPTSCRTMGFGMVGVSAALVGLLAPQLAYLGSRWPSIPLFVFGGCSFLGACASFLLQETKGKPLTEEVKKNRKLSIVSIVDNVKRLSIGGLSGKV